MNRGALVVFGTRPEAIKLMPVIGALRKARIATTLVATGQHRELLDQVLSLFGETVAVDLQVMSECQSLSTLTAKVLEGVTDVIARTKPALVIVHGDTTTAMAASLAAFYSGTILAHVESGLRTFDLDHPWPEEFNRVTIDSLANYLFAPSETAAANLRATPGLRGRVYVTGNTGIDAVLQMAQRIDERPELQRALASRYAMIHPHKKLVLVTAHRRESFGEGLRRICAALELIARRDDVKILFPMHLNPNAREPVVSALSGLPSVHLIEPTDYAQMVFLMRRAHLILTDSGGIQEEAPAFGIPTLVMRDVTERPEAIATGVAKLVGTDPETICNAVDALIDDAELYRATARPVFPYGDGTAARKIARILQEEVQL
jgi:UDP-N-acetylglucosamine 2-epimerase (non-hydrolysing)